MVLRGGGGGKASTRIRRQCLRMRVDAFPPPPLGTISDGRLHIAHKVTSAHLHRLYPSHSPNLLFSFPQTPNPLALPSCSSYSFSLDPQSVDKSFAHHFEPNISPKCASPKSTSS